MASTPRLRDLGGYLAAMALTAIGPLMDIVAEIAPKGGARRPAGHAGNEP